MTNSWRSWSGWRRQRLWYWNIKYHCNNDPIAENKTSIADPFASYHPGHTVMGTLAETFCLSRELRRFVPSSFDVSSTSYGWSVCTSAWQYKSKFHSYVLTYWTPCMYPHYGENVCSNIVATETTTIWTDLVCSAVATPWRSHRYWDAPLWQVPPRLLSELPQYVLFRFCIHSWQRLCFAVRVSLSGVKFHEHDVPLINFPSVSQSFCGLLHALLSWWLTRAVV